MVLFRGFEIDADLLLFIDQLMMGIIKSDNGEVFLTKACFDDPIRLPFTMIEPCNETDKDKALYIFHVFSLSTLKPESDFPK